MCDVSVRYSKACSNGNLGMVLQFVFWLISLSSSSLSSRVRRKEASAAAATARRSNLSNNMLSLLYTKTTNFSRRLSQLSDCPLTTRLKPPFFCSLFRMRPDLDPLSQASPIPSRAVCIGSNQQTPSHLWLFVHNWQQSLALHPSRTLGCESSPLRYCKISRSTP